VTRTGWKVRRLVPILIAGLMSCATGGSSDDSFDAAALEREVATLINAHRKESKLPRFSYDDKVASLARKHSQDMAQGKFPLGHDGFEARVKEISGFLALAGAGENVSEHQGKSDFAERAVREWLDSPVHRKNIDGDYGVTGVGAARSADGKVFFTQIFVRVR
jgi:uncharacterized protein YkwD